MEQQQKKVYSLYRTIGIGPQGLVMVAALSFSDIVGKAVFFYIKKNNIFLGFWFDTRFAVGPVLINWCFPGGWFILRSQVLFTFERFQVCSFVCLFVCFFFNRMSVSNHRINCFACKHRFIMAIPVVACNQ